jgi:myo-inositol 2-dehydrogenase/D-chiro-inositol 1-dehydrogenase
VPRIALVGVGRIGRLHAANVARVTGLELVAASDPDPEAARSLGCEAVEDWRELVGRTDVDAVALCSPTALHAEQVAACADAGKHVFCEKPLASDLAAADRALEAVEAAGVLLQVGYNRRFDRSYAAVRDAVASGRIGRPVIVRVTARDPEPPSRSYLEGRAANALFVDTTSHDLDLVRFVTGEEIVEVSAHASTLVSDDARELGLVDTAVTTLVMESGALATIDNCWYASYGYDQRLEVHGTDGAVRAENARRDTTVIADAEGVHEPPLPYFFLDRYGETFLAELEAFAAALGGAPVPVTGRDGRAALAAALAAGRSSDESRSVRIAELG